MKSIWYCETHSLKNADPTKIEFHITPVLTYVKMQHKSNCSKGGILALEWGCWAISIGRFTFDHEKYRNERYEVKEAIEQLDKCVTTFNKLTLNSSNKITAEENNNIGIILDNISDCTDVLFMKHVKQN